jgi:hypothetical protein
VEAPVLALERPVAGGVTVDAARMLQDLSGFHEERHGALRRVRDTREGIDGQERPSALRERQGWAEPGRETACREREGGAGGQELPRSAVSHVISAQALSRVNGSRRTRCRVRWKSAFATAGAIGGTPGSPTPVGGAAEGTMWTSTGGISSMRSGR